MRVIEQLNQSIRCAATYNSEAQAAPFCILWPDKDRQWESVIGKLQGLLPDARVKIHGGGHGLPWQAPGAVA